jgi:formate-dependent nitrite reductase cytochrome c552 subunit
MPNLAQICADCEAESERIVNGLVSEISDLMAKNDKSEQIIEDLIKQKEELQAALDAKPETSIPSEAVIKLLELIKPDIDRLELIKTEDPRLQQIPGVFREIEGSGNNEYKTL